jgi:hypothetical protein
MATDDYPRLLIRPNPRTHLCILHGSSDIDKVCKMFAVYTIPEFVAVLALKLQPLDVGRAVFQVPGERSANVYHIHVVVQPHVTMLSSILLRIHLEEDAHISCILISGFPAGL